MPLVRRKVVHEVSTTFSKIKAHVTKYVSPTRVRPGDEIVPPTDRQLAELAALYPKEYGPLAKQRGVTPVDLDALRAANDPDDDYDPDLDADLEGGEDAEGNALDEAQRTFLELSGKDAAEFVQENKDRRDFLAKLYAAEAAQPKPRTAVMKLFKAFAIGAE